MADTKKEDEVSKVFTPFGVMVGDAGSMKAFDDETFYEEVLKPSEKAMYEKYKKDFLKNPKDKTKKVSSGVDRPERKDYDDYIQWQDAVRSWETDKKLGIEEGDDWSVRYRKTGFLPSGNNKNSLGEVVTGKDHFRRELTGKIIDVWPEHGTVTIKEEDGSESQIFTNTLRNASSGFIPWDKLPIKSKARNLLVLDKIMSNTWALNKEAIPGFIDLIEKLRGKYSTVIGDDKLLEYLEAAQHRARELEASGEVSGSSSAKSETNSSLNALRSAYNLGLFYKTKLVSQSVEWQVNRPSSKPAYQREAEEAALKKTEKGLGRKDIHEFWRENRYHDRGRDDHRPPRMVCESVEWQDSRQAPKSRQSKVHVKTSNFEEDGVIVGHNGDHYKIMFGDGYHGVFTPDEFSYVSSSVDYNESGIPVNSDPMDPHPCLYVGDTPVWIERGFSSDQFGRHEDYTVTYQSPAGDWCNKLGFPLDSSLEEIEEEVARAVKEDMEIHGLDSSYKLFSNAEGIDQQAYNNYVQQLVQMGIPEDQARQQADQLVAQLKQNTAQFAQNMQQPSQQGSTGLAMSFKRFLKSGTKNLDDYFWSEDYIKDKFKVGDRVTTSHGLGTIVAIPSVYDEEKDHPDSVDIKMDNPNGFRDGVSRYFIGEFELVNKDESFVGASKKSLKSGHPEYFDHLGNGEVVQRPSWVGDKKCRLNDASCQWYVADGTCTRVGVCDGLASSKKSVKSSFSNFVLPDGMPEDIWDALCGLANKYDFEDPDDGDMFLEEAYEKIAGLSPELYQLFLDNYADFYYAEDEDELGDGFYDNGDRDPRYLPYSGDDPYFDSPSPYDSPAVFCPDGRVHDFIRILTGLNEGDYRCTNCGDVKTFRQIRQLGLPVQD